MSTDTTEKVTATEIVLPGIVEPDDLQIRRRELPPLKPGEALVRVEATGVSFAEQGMRRGRYPGQPKFPFVLGYDVVGSVQAVGDPANQGMVGGKFAAATKTGGWATHTVVKVGDLIPVPDGLEPAAVETMVVNGITAYQMLYRSARIRSGQTVLVHGAAGGVGNVLVQLAVQDGIRVIGTASPRNHQALRDLGAEPIDYRGGDLSARVRELAPDGVDAVFDHLGPKSFRTSFPLLADGGTLVAYGSAASLHDDNSMIAMFVGMLARLYSWNVLPNKRRANFYNFWGGHVVSLKKFRRRQHADLAAVLQLLAQGSLKPQIAATFPLTEAAAALKLAESRSISGKVILLP